VWFIGTGGLLAASPLSRNINDNETMIPKVYVGPALNLGRFGFVKDGDLLNLTAHEWSTLERSGDKRFRDPKPNYAPPKVVLDAKLTAEDRQKAMDAEAYRQAQLTKANSPSVTDSMAHDGLTRTQLLEKAQEMKAEGYKIVFQKTASRNVLIKAIKLAMEVRAGEKTEAQAEEEAKALSESEKG
jgi:hypothetical protein